MHGQFSRVPGAAVLLSASIPGRTARRVKLFILPDPTASWIRLKNPKPYLLEVRVGENLIKDSFEFGTINSNSSPQFNGDNIHLSSDLTFENRLTRELLTHIPRADRSSGLMFILGSDTHHDLKKVFSVINFEYIGLNYQGRKPDLLGDAHSLPFQGDVFDFVVSLAVLEHLRHPLVAMKEVYRVLKPGKLFIGTVAFLEPFHQNSYYHHIHLEIYIALVLAGFEVRQIKPNIDWPGLQAIVKMSTFPDLTEEVTLLLAWVIRAIGIIWCVIQHFRDNVNEEEKLFRYLHTTGGYRFIAVKPVKILDPRG